jgi:hypothetical protein
LELSRIHSKGFEQFYKLIGFRSAIEPNCYDGLARAIVAAKRYRAAERGSRQRRDLLPFSPHLPHEVKQVERYAVEGQVVFDFVQFVVGD